VFFFELIYATLTRVVVTYVRCRLLVVMFNVDFYI